MGAGVSDWTAHVPTSSVPSAGVSLAALIRTTREFVKNEERSDGHSFIGS